jgi:acetolactate synthase-1/2/3 large subunit
MLAGGMMMHLMDAFGRQQGIRYYCHHHEQAAAMAGDGYAKQTGKLGVCLATSGPGATNLLTGLVGAWQDSTPILFLTGQCKRCDTMRASGITGLRQYGFLEVDIVPIVESVTKYAAFVESPERTRYHLEKALHLARSGRPGPVLLDIPLDIQGASVEISECEPFVPESMPQAIASEIEIDWLLDQIGNSRMPLILAGNGIRCAGLTPIFRQLLDSLPVPVVTSLMAKDLLPYEHPLFVGHPGPRAERAANFAVQSADLILIMGCSLNLQTTGYEGPLFAPNAHKIQIDLDHALLEREKIGVQTKRAWDLQQYLPLLLERARRRHICPQLTWLDACHNWKRSYQVIHEPHELGEADGPVNLYEFVDRLSAAVPADATILTDAGQPHPIMAQTWRTKDGQRYLNPGSLAGMGYALPASMGVAAAEPDRMVVAVIGDGSLQTNIHELQTLVHYGFNLKLFVINNGGYGSIRNTQSSFFKGFYVGSTPETGVSMPDTRKITDAYGVPYVLLENRSSLSQRIADVLAKPGPVLCEVMARHTQRMMPVVPSYMLADGQMRSKALQEMVPDIGKTFDEVLEGAGLALPVSCQA